MWRYFLVGCLLLLLSGCSANHSVSGKVTLDDAPLQEGYIAFVPEGPGQGGGSQIADGKYSIQTLPGKYRVEITASKLMPLPDGQVGMDGAKEEVRQYIPAQYNTNTELKAEVPASGPADFQLQSK